MSKRDKPPSARSVRTSAQALRRRSEWDPERVLGKRERPEQRLAREIAAESSDAAYQAADGCEVCSAARAESGDDTALCDEHMAAAMGL